MAFAILLSHAKTYCIYRFLHFLRNRDENWPTLFTKKSVAFWNVFCVTILTFLVSRRYDSCTLLQYFQMWHVLLCSLSPCSLSAFSSILSAWRVKTNTCKLKAIHFLIKASFRQKSISSWDLHTIHTAHFIMYNFLSGLEFCRKFIILNLPNFVFWWRELRSGWSTNELSSY